MQKDQKKVEKNAKTEERKEKKKAIEDLESECMQFLKDQVEKNAVNDTDKLLELSEKHFEGKLVQ